jgi:hypothetical protein
MDTNTAALIGLGILALAIVAFFAVFRGKGKFTFKGIFGEVKAEGANPPPPSAVPSGVKIHDVDAGRNVIARSSSAAGGAEIQKAKAKTGTVKGTHTPGEPSPKN